MTDQLPRHRIVVVAAVAVVLVSALAALVLTVRNGSCAEPLRCVYPIGGTGCLPGACAAARHRAALQAAETLVVGLVLGGVLAGLSYRLGDHPAIKEQ